MYVTIKSVYLIVTDHKDHLGLKSKILIKNFLMDKKEGLELFFGFLSGTGILGRVRTKSTNNKCLICNTFSTLLILLNRLLVTNFIHGFFLMKLTGTVIKEDVVSTTSVLYNCYEKIGFALALQSLQSKCVL